MENENFSNVNSLLMQLQESFQSLAALDQNLSQHVQSLAKIQSSVKQMTNNTSINGASIGQTEEIRKGIAMIRVAVQQTTDRLEESQDESVQAYRHILGQNKEQFEAASDAEKQSLNSAAYHSLQLYRQLKSTMELLNRFDGELMDASQQVEHDMIHQLPHPDVHLERDFENDPAPHPLT